MGHGDWLVKGNRNGESHRTDAEKTEQVRLAELDSQLGMVDTHKETSKKVSGLVLKGVGGQDGR